MTAEWRELLALIPGYDAELTAAPGDYFDPDAAELALSFFPECLRFIEGDRAGEPFELEPWQAAIVAALWGWKRANGTRRFRECLCYVPRKSGKTPLAAGLLLLAMFTDGEPGNQLYSAGPTKDTAALVYRHAAGMVAQEPELLNRVRCYRTFKSIEYGNTVYKALAGDTPSTLHGLNAGFVLVDELHAHKDAELVETLMTATASRRQPLVIHITTADWDRPSVCNTKYDYACKVRDGQLSDPSFLPVIYEAAPDDDWTDPAVWAKANPNLGVSVRLEYLERECARAKAEPSYTNTFRRLHLNQRTSTATKWLSLSDWDACAAELPELTGRECYAGLDLSTTTDVSAFVLAFPDAERIILVPHFWIPARKLEASRTDRVPYALWQRQGFVTVTDGDVVDYDRIRADIVALAARYSLQEVRVDPWNATQISGQLAEQDGLTVTHMRQGYISMNAPTKELERRIIARTILHDANPVLRWMIGNTVVVTDDSGNIKPSKGRARERVDGTVAAIMAVSGAMNGTRASVYQERGLITI